jgi:hypothetical protein
LNKDKVYFQLAIADVCGELRVIFNNSKDYYLENSDVNFKVRPGYGYDKFYLDFVEDSSDMSLQALIHFILFEKNHFKKFISKKTYKKLMPFMKRYPEILYDFSGNQSEQNMIDRIELLCINYIRCLFKYSGLDDQVFIDAGYDLEPQLSNITSHAYIFEYTAIYYFSYDLNIYLKTNSLTQEELNEILKVSKNIYIVDHLLGIADSLHEKYSVISKEIIKETIQKVIKRNQYILIAMKIKKLFKDENWADEVKRLKETL